MPSPFFLTTAIDYANGRPHLGTAYEKITADVIARYKRLSGIETHFLMGLDEHSLNVYRKAREQGLDPLTYCDQMAAIFRDVWARLDISFDDFIRTTEPRHRVAVQAMTEKIRAAGDLYEGVYEGWYCESCEAFKPEKDLVDGLCPIHRTTPAWIRETNHFFRLSAYRDRLLAHFAAHPEFLQPDVRRNEILRLLEAGLEDISISRAGQPWGIPVPHDPSSVVYVWFDALINYITAVGYGADPERLAKWWPADLHIVGKDITRFHAVVWPAMLMSAGEALPRQVFGHGWVHFKGEKMSKSLGTAVDPLEAAERLGCDPLRLYLVKEVPYGGDGDFSWERFEERYNADLANNLGNLVSRVASMAERYVAGRVAPTGDPGPLAAAAGETLAAYRAAMDVYALHDAANAIYRLLGAANEYIEQTAPWKLAKDPAHADRLGQVLFDVAEVLRVAAVLLLPVMPGSAREILRRVGETADPATLRLDDAAWKPSGERTLVKGEALWPRLEAASAPAPPVRGAMSDSPTPPPAPSPASPATPPAPSASVASTPAEAPTPNAGPGAAPPTAPAAADVARITFDDLMRVDLRVAKVLAAERVPKSSKLLKLSVDVGTETRTIVAGLGEAYEPEAMVGRTIAIVANLAPRKMMGIESNGMVLAGGPDGAKPELVTFADPPPPPGSRIR
ncbi:MAG: methionine--tRNA ligase [Vicinamibacteraceae bacterium]